MWLGIRDMKEVMTDESIMPFGSFKGRKMANVPAWYLISMYEDGGLYGSVKAYVEENMDVLMKERSETKISEMDQKSELAEFDYDEDDDEFFGSVLNDPIRD